MKDERPDVETRARLSLAGLCIERCEQSGYWLLLLADDADPALGAPIDLIKTYSGDSHGYGATSYAMCWALGAAVSARFAGRRTFAAVEHGASGWQGMRTTWSGAVGGTPLTPGNALEGLLLEALDAWTAMTGAPTVRLRKRNA